MANYRNIFGTAALLLALAIAGGAATPTQVQRAETVLALPQRDEIGGLEAFRSLVRTCLRARDLRAAGDLAGAEALVAATAWRDPARAQTVLAFVTARKAYVLPEPPAEVPTACLLRLVVGYHYLVDVGGWDPPALLDRWRAGDATVLSDLERFESARAAGDARAARLHWQVLARTMATVFFEPPVRGARSAPASAAAPPAAPLAAPPAPGLPASAAAAALAGLMLAAAIAVHRRRGVRAARAREQTAMNEAVRRAVTEPAPHTEPAREVAPARSGMQADPTMPRVPMPPRALPPRYRDVTAVAGAPGLFAAHDAQLAAAVEVRVLTDGAPAELASRFRSEAERLASLAHPGVARVVDVGTTAAGAPYCACESGDGPSLAALLASAPLPHARAVDLAAQVAGALERAHAAGIAHRALCASSVCVSADDLVRLVRFDPGGAGGVDEDLAALGDLLDRLHAVEGREGRMLAKLAVRCRDAGSADRPTAAQVARALARMRAQESRDGDAAPIVPDPEGPR